MDQKKRLEWLRSTTAYWAGRSCVTILCFLEGSGAITNAVLFFRAEDAEIKRLAVGSTSADVIGLAVGGVLLSVISWHLLNAIFDIADSHLAPRTGLGRQPDTEEMELQ